MAKKFGDLFGNMDDVFSGAKISNFDLDDVLSRTRTFTEEVSKKSAEALELSRKKVECLDIKAKLSKAYERYGRLAYEAVQQPQLQQTEALESCGAEITALRTKLDQLMDLVGELVTTESMVVSNPDLKGLHLDNFSKSARELRKLTDELQDVVMSMRMVPLSGVFQKMNRIVRDMCKKLDKEVDLITEGGDTEVDKTINEAIADPFMHMVRNSMDHAIESPEERLALGKPEHGQVALRAKNIGGEIVITISDDGRGLDTESILKKARNNGILTKPENEYTEKEIFNLIMLPGFSTNTEVTEYSGRGVGMDVVRKNIEKVGGTISIDSKAGQGTTFTLKIPLTLAIMDGMELAVGGSVFTMPITSIKQSFKFSRDQQLVRDTDGSEMIMLRGECFPLIRLHEIFQIPTEVTELSEGIVMQIENGDQIALPRLPQPVFHQAAGSFGLQYPGRRQHQPDPGCQQPAQPQFVRQKGVLT